MSFSFTLQVLAQLVLLRNFAFLPKEFDEIVAKLHFIARALFTVFAQEHTVYISVKVEGPFKVEHYRYRDASFSREYCRWQRFWRNW